MPNSPHAQHDPIQDIKNLQDQTPSDKYKPLSEVLQELYGDPSDLKPVTSVRPQPGSSSKNNLQDAANGIHPPFGTRYSRDLQKSSTAPSDLDEEEEFDFPGGKSEVPVFQTSSATYSDEVTGEQMTLMLSIADRWRSSDISLQEFLLQLRRNAKALGIS